MKTYGVQAEECLFHLGYLNTMLHEFLISPHTTLANCIILLNLITLLFFRQPTGVRLFPALVS